MLITSPKHYFTEFFTYCPSSAKPTNHEKRVKNEFK